MLLSTATQRFVIGCISLIGGIGCVIAMMFGGISDGIIAAVASPVTLLLNHSGQIIRHLFPGGAEKEKP